MEKNKPFFSWRTAILNSDLPATTRHLLLTLSCHMNDVGESCFPSMDTLAIETGLTKRAVVTHIGIAKKSGWIKIRRHGFGDERYWRNEYVMALPDSDLTSHDPRNDRSLYESTIQTLAHKAVQNALERGDLIKEPCEVCRDPNAEAHHDDYSKPLDVRWVCRKHHKAIHLSERSASSLSEPRSPSTKTLVNDVPNLGERGDQTLVNDVYSSTPVNSTVNSTNHVGAHAPRYSTDDLAIARTMYAGLCMLNPNHKAPNFSKWAESIRLLRERDGRPAEEIRSMWEWVHNDAFWRVNILSPDKLREKWDQLAIKRNSGKHEAHQHIDNSAPGRVRAANAAARAKAERVD